MRDRPYPVLDLFAGYGGFSLAFEAAGLRTIGFSEIDPYASAILAHRWPDVPNLGPVQSVTRDSVLARCGVLPTVITGGFPCQPHSMAGKRGASADERDLWPECWRVLRDLRPRFALFENVAGLLTSERGLFLNRVLSDLAEISYACQLQVVSAADVGAPHRRERVWLLCVDELAYGDGLGRAHGQPRVHATEGRLDALGDVAASGDAGLADRKRPRLEGHAGDGAGSHEPGRVASGPHGSVGASGVRGAWPAARGLWPARPGERQYEWEPARVAGVTASAGLPDQRGERGPMGEPRAVAQPERPDEALAGERKTLASVGRDVDGSSDGPHAAPAQVCEAEAGDAVNRVHRLKALGNGIVPAVAYVFAAAIAEQLGASAATDLEAAA